MKALILLSEASLFTLSTNSQSIFNLNFEKIADSIKKKCYPDVDRPIQFKGT
ncbi:hypothetical protein [Pedobacter sp. Hv1]|uniref:hypothetical protein n=1 Tax=Pedobacter sp. Hv1 TaxID=1740090 RepID=UPI000A40E601|nr:hypothetical protein [Pedobacter sp. Hv1]